MRVTLRVWRDDPRPGVLDHQVLAHRQTWEATTIGSVGIVARRRMEEAGLETPERDGQPWSSIEIEVKR